MSGAEVAAVYNLARTPEERQALRKLLALTQGAGTRGQAAWPD